MEKNVKKLKCVYTGMGGNRYLAENLWPIIKKNDYELRIISEWNANFKFPEIEYVKWDRSNWLQKIKECDVVICPQNVEKQPAKSNNKVTQAMALGMPVIASPLPAYLEIIEDSENGYIANTSKEWATCLRILRSGYVRKRIGEKAMETAKKYSVKEMGAKWIDSLKKLGQNKVAVKNTPTNPQIKVANPAEQTPNGSKQIRIAIVYDKIGQIGDYISYGDHWYNACVDVLGKENIYQFEVEEIMSGMAVADFDLYFFINIDNRYFKIPEKYRPRILYSWDTHLHFFVHMQQLIPHFDKCFLNHKVDVERLNAQGFTNCHWIPEAYNPKLHTPTDTFEEYDVGFIGQQDDVIVRKGHTRKDFLIAMDREYKAFIGQKFYGAGYVYHMNRCKVIFDRTIATNIGTRFFESLAMKKPLLYNINYETAYKLSGLDELYKEERKSLKLQKIRNANGDKGCYTYFGYDDTIEDFKRSLRILLEDKELRDKVATNGYNWVKPYTYSNNLRKMLKVLEKEL